MDTNILKFEFNEQEVEFNFAQGNVMVNATQMAKLFDKKVEAFMRNEDVKSFIFECLKSENSRFLNVETEEDLYTSTQKTGTFMHRILALKFAAWLSPAFELWVFRTIDEILFGNMRMVEQSLKESASRKDAIDMRKEALKDNPDYLALQILELQERQAAYSRTKIAKAQLQSMRQTSLQLD